MVLNVHRNMLETGRKGVGRGYGGGVVVGVGDYIPIATLAVTPDGLLH